MVFRSGYITFSPIRLLRSGHMIFPSFGFLSHEWPPSLFFPQLLGMKVKMEDTALEGRYEEVGQVLK